MRKILFLIESSILKCIRFFYSWLSGGQSCVVCDSKTYYYPVCKKCQNSYFNVDSILTVPRCNVCGKVLTSTFETCIRCRTDPIIHNVDKSYPLFSYRLWNKELLFMWKISGVRSLSEFYAKLLNRALNYLEIKNIVPVPPRKGKIQKNGWDQVDELCKFLEFKYGFTVLKLLERNSTVQQKKLNKEERLQTIENAYSIRDSIHDYIDFLPEKVCLLDDVSTTGSTIECCAKLLKKAGVKEVVCVTLYIVD